MTEPDIYGYLLDNTDLTAEKARDLSAEIYKRLDYSSMYEQIDTLVQLLTTPDWPMKRKMFATRVDSDTPEIIDSIAKEFGCLRINSSGEIVGSAGVLLDKIAQGHLTIIPTSPDWPTPSPLH